jgi:sulfate adenylyltransferase large subunit
MSAPLIRVCTAGSVDDGKSTLIGRLLFDSKALMTDQLAHVEEASRRRGFARTELALLTDGLRAEREQGITIDVAWRYFAIPDARFILADAPGHVQYTRNMVTGASTADVVVLLIDARRGVTEQTRRHLAFTRMLGVPELVVCVNKMDQVDFSVDRYVELREEIAAYLAAQGQATASFVPIAALGGDNVATRSTRTPFYDGPTLLERLVAVRPRAREDAAALRFPVQWVIRPQSEDHRDYRGYAGRIAGGSVRAGDRVRVVSSGIVATVARVESGGEVVDVARAGESAVVHLQGDLDVGRGDLLVPEDDAAVVASRAIEADLFWFAPRPVKPGARYVLKHATRRTRAVVEAVEDRLDLATFTRAPAGALAVNEIGRARLRAAVDLAWEPYETSRATGASSTR